MSRRESFWRWFIGGITDALRGTLHLAYENWYIILIFIGCGGTISLSMYSLVTYSSPSFVWVGDVFQRVEPVIKPWMVLYPSISFIVLIIGLYVYWRKSIQSSTPTAKMEE